MCWLSVIMGSWYCFSPVRRERRFFPYPFLPSCPSMGLSLQTVVSLSSQVPQSDKPRPHSLQISLCDTELRIPQPLICGPTRYLDPLCSLSRGLSQTKSRGHMGYPRPSHMVNNFPVSQRRQNSQTFLCHGDLSFLCTSLLPSFSL